MSKACRPSTGPIRAPLSPKPLPVRRATSDLAISNKSSTVALASSLSILWNAECLTSKLVSTMTSQSRLAPVCRAKTCRLASELSEMKVILHTSAPRRPPVNLAAKPCKQSTMASAARAGLPRPKRRSLRIGRISLPWPTKCPSPTRKCPMSVSVAGVNGRTPACGQAAACGGGAAKEATLSRGSSTDQGSNKKFSAHPKVASALSSRTPRRFRISAAVHVGTKLPL
mmetsp:Transcript_36762/g.104647  ORF Transcript_36762/g.104647 Transcript_36762/m.104647 type:complete len:227 (+) Transcript_36762:221-901(+)